MGRGQRALPRRQSQFGGRLKLKNKRTSLRRAAILWFIASALALAAALLNYINEGRFRWPTLAAALFTGLMGVNMLRQSRSQDGG